jgi:release factor glutamine methyltransferase
MLELPDAPAMTVAGALREAAAVLREAGIDDPGRDARRLLSSVLEMSGAQILGHPEHPLTAAQNQLLQAYCARRRRREPVSRILGEREFYGRRFRVSPATLDPRPDSETLIETALGIARGQALRGAPLRILDIGTGGGCLLLTLLCELPDAVGVGVDISEPALAVARENARHLSVPESRVRWLVRDALGPLEGGFGLVIANPPYVRSGDIAGLDPEVRDFDPRMALDGGPDGLRFYRQLAVTAPTLAAEGWIVLEVGHDQASTVAGLLKGNPRVDADSIGIRKDATGNPRCVAARARG